MSQLSLNINSFTSKWFHPALPISKTDLTGRTVIVTGANIGLGLEAAKHFYSMNPARLIIAVRTVSKGEAAKQEILQSHSAGQTKVDVWELDLSSFESTKRFAKKVNAELDRLDILLENAGVAVQDWNTTVDGWEVSLQTNVLSTFLLAALLLPLLKKTVTLPSPRGAAPFKPHIAIVASSVHKIAQFPEQSAPHIFNALNDKEHYQSTDRYPLTKLLDVLLTKEFAKADCLHDGQISICSVTPGFCRSELMRQAPWIMREALYAVLARTTEEGSRNLVWASLADDIPPGAYGADCAVEKPGPFVESPEGIAAQQKLWKEMSEILTAVAPETAPVWNIKG